MMPTRIATWNLDHASNSKRPIDKQVATLLTFNPDVAVLTETCKEVEEHLKEYRCVPTEANAYGKYCAAIFYRSNIELEEQIPTTDAIDTVCARLRIPALGRVIVYGTIISYHGYKGRDNKSKTWEEHYKAIERQGNDWQTIRQNAIVPTPLIVAGDINQTRDGSKVTYGTNFGRMLLTKQIEQNNDRMLDYGKFWEYREATTRSQEALAEKQHRSHFRNKGRFQHFTNWRLGSF